MNTHNLASSFQTNPATKPTPWTLIDATGTTYSTALATIVDAASSPSTNMSTGRFVVTLEKPVLQLLPIISDADNETAAFGVYGVRRINTALNTQTNYWSFTTLWTGTATAGAKVYTGSGNYRYADAISTTTAALPTSAYRVIATTDDQAILEMDVRDFEMVLIVGTLSGSTGAAVTFAYSTLPL